MKKVIKKVVKKVSGKSDSAVGDNMAVEMKAEEAKPEAVMNPEIKPEAIKTTGGQEVVPPVTNDTPKIMLEAVVEGLPEIKSEVNDMPAAMVEQAGKMSDETMQKPEVPAGSLATSISNLASIVEKGEQNDVKGTSSDDAESGSSRAKSGGAAVWIFVAFCVGLGFGIISGYVLWGKPVMKFDLPFLAQKKAEIKTTPTPKLMPTPTVAEEPQLKREDLKIKVLNGTNKTGVAARAKDYLEELGYKGVTAGNSSKNYETTQVVMSQTKSKYWDMLRKDLSGQYAVADNFTVDEKLLLSSDGADVVVTVGEK